MKSPSANPMPGRYKDWAITMTGDRAQTIQAILAVLQDIREELQIMNCVSPHPNEFGLSLNQMRLLREDWEKYFSKPPVKRKKKK